MKRAVLFLGLLILGSPAQSQQALADVPATKEDVERYFEAMHVRDLTRQIIDSMSTQMRQLVHEQYVADPTHLPPDFEERMGRMLNDLYKEIPFDQMFDLMVPVYQKHLTKGDIDSIVAFYSTPVGQKLIRELPAMTQESMQAMMPFMQKYMTKMQERVRQEIAEMVKQHAGKPAPEHP